MRRLRSVLAVACLLPLPALAATLFGVVSERAAPLAAEAAAKHVAAHPGDRLLLRTPAQLLAMPDKQLARALAEADAVLAVAVFGDPARRLKEALPQARTGTRVVALNGEATLSLMSRPAPDAPLAGFPGETLRNLTLEKPPADALAAAAAHPGARAWLALRQTWQAGGADNVANLYRHLLHPALPLPVPQPEPALRLRAISDKGSEERSDAAAWRWQPVPTGPALVVLDLANADPAPADAICAASRRKGVNCIAVMARWAATSREVVERLPELVAPAKPAALVVLQDFVVGAAEHREAVGAALARLDVPVFKAIRLTDRTAMQWRLSPDGLPPDSVQYRVALPELQGSGQPIVVAASGKPTIDRLTGIEIRRPEVLTAEVERLAARAARWQALAQKKNFDKRVALIYYNHPPGRQNIGADNLDVPASLFHVLREMKAAGYDTGELPATPEALLEMIMERGVNLPEDRAELARMAPNVNGVGAADYARWFGTLSPRVRGEMVDGPLGRLHAEVLEAERAGERTLGQKRVEAALKELRHLVEGADHPRRDEAIKLLAKLEDGYRKCLAERAKTACAGNAATARRLAALAIEGLRGWGAAPGRVMVHGRGHDARLLIPGLVFGKVFVGPQPPRGWEVDEELLHANTSITPPHQFLAFYHWLRDAFRADALVHLGRHSTYEFLPGKAVGLASDDYPSLVASDLPGIYPYIVDGVGEGVQAKRRGLAVIVDHLTPPLAATPLYDRLLALRQVVESFEASSSEAIKAAAARTMREQVAALNLKQELEASMADVLAVRGIGFEQADDELLAHEIGHYLTKLQEKFMPHGLHVFGKDWSRESLDLMLASMKQGGVDDPAVADKLAASPKLEMAALLAGLAGRYVAPGKGNDPLRSPEALPTGRNFHAVDGDLLPTRLGYKLGQDFAARALKKKAAHEGSEAVILWASDAVRDEGVMVGFALALMGAEPVWNARGIVTDVRLVSDAPRRDVIVTTSGLFRDLYPNLLRLIDRAGLLALAASANALVRERPELQDAVTAALQPLPAVHWGDEAPAANRVAVEWRRRVDALRQRGLPPAVAGREAALRTFGDAPGAYGAGINRLTERSGAWHERLELGKVYRTRLGHAYGLAADGEAAHAAFDSALANVGRAWHGRASNLYGVLDNNDAFDYLGGLSLAVEGLTGRRPEGLILQHADPGRADIEPLATAVLGELRGRFLNPAWLKPLMGHGYAGARTMGQEFLENLWGWQVTRPDLIENWAWDEVKSVYLDDAHKLGLPEFLGRGANAHVKAHMLSIFLVAAHKGFWQTDAATIERLGGELARLVARNGLPGSGHAAPNHPMWEWLAPQLAAADAQALGVVLARARGENVPAAYAPAAAAAKPTLGPQAAAAATLAAPVPVAEAAAEPAPSRAYELERAAPAAAAPIPWAALALLPFLFVAGLWRGTTFIPTSTRRPT
ncbi:cobaltochelatase subunit CobN [Azospira restricta]|uniref:Cobaltochelatase subunit CobN n=1 Tax=Azospira restricta TaxID=404405 RepID=A0A974SPQ3_9RHOO|nr:cobaltochelatase subunit CobN [Azospira restricta]QRJ64182.1 cobaltochelatase subunit CobN [Azospira restricta]